MNVPALRCLTALCLVVLAQSAGAVTLGLLSESRSVSVDGSSASGTYSNSVTHNLGFGAWSASASGSVNGSSGSASQSSMIGPDQITLSGQLFTYVSAPTGVSVANAYSDFSVNFSVAQATGFIWTGTRDLETLHGWTNYTLSSTLGTITGNWTFPTYNNNMQTVTGVLQPGVVYTLGAHINDWHAVGSNGYDAGSAAYSMTFVTTPDGGSAALLFALAIGCIGWARRSRFC